MKRILLLILIIQLSQTHILGQEDSIQIKKNAIKGISIPYSNEYFSPVVPLLSLGYERIVSKNASLDLTTNFLYRANTEGPDTGKVLLLSYASYKHYYTSKNKRIRNFWFGPYISNLLPIYSRVRGERSYAYGIGAFIGKKTYFTSKKSFFLDIGIGMSVNRYITYNERDLTLDREILVIPRPIFIIGKQF